MLSIAIHVATYTGVHVVGLILELWGYFATLVWPPGFALPRRPRQTGPRLVGPPLSKIHYSLGMIPLEPVG